MPAPEQMLWFRARRCTFGGDESRDNHPQMPTTSNLIMSRANRSDGGEEARVWMKAGAFIWGPGLDTCVGFMCFLASVSVLSPSKSKCSLQLWSEERTAERGTNTSTTGGCNIHLWAVTTSFSTGTGRKKRKKDGKRLQEDAEKRVHVFVTLRLDHWNSPLWLPYEFKTLLLTYEVLNAKTLFYLKELKAPDRPTGSLRCEDAGDLAVPRVCCRPAWYYCDTIVMVRWWDSLSSSFLLQLRE